MNLLKGELLMNRVKLAKELVRLARELMADGNFAKAKDYVKRIRNENKRKFAEAYLNYLMTPNAKIPDYRKFGLSGMGAQAVWLGLGKLGFRKEARKLAARPLSVPEQHQKKIAISTLKLSDFGARIMGGMTKEEAREFLKSIGYTDQQIRKIEE